METERYKEISKILFGSYMDCTRKIVPPGCEKEALVEPTAEEKEMAKWILTLPNKKIQAVFQFVLSFIVDSPSPDELREYKKERKKRWKTYRAAIEKYLQQGNKLPIYGASPNDYKGIREKMNQYDKVDIMILSETLGFDFEDLFMFWDGGRKKGSALDFEK